MLKTLRLMKTLKRAGFKIVRSGYRSNTGLSTEPASWTVIGNNSVAAKIRKQGLFSLPEVDVYKTELSDYIRRLALPYSRAADINYIDMSPETYEVASFLGEPKVLYV